MKDFCIKKIKKLGFCVLDFDILNAKILKVLCDIKTKVDFLVVGIKEDYSFSFVPFEEKKKILEAVDFIDYVLDFPVFYINDFIEILKPSYYIDYPICYKKEIYDLILEKNNY